MQQLDITNINTTIIRRRVIWISLLQNYHVLWYFRNFGIWNTFFIPRRLWLSSIYNDGRSFWHRPDNDRLCTLIWPWSGTLSLAVSLTIPLLCVCVFESFTFTCPCVCVCLSLCLCLCLPVFCCLLSVAALLNSLSLSLSLCVCSTHLSEMSGMGSPCDRKLSWL